jgi:hypothetical protein
VKGHDREQETGYDSTPHVRNNTEAGDRMANPRSCRNNSLLLICST